MMFPKMSENAALLTDGYKFCHKDQYPDGLEWMYETWTSRLSRIENVSHAVFFGLQGALATLYWEWQKNFFERPFDEVMAEIKDDFSAMFEQTNPEMVKNYDFSHFEKLHKLGYLPIKVKALLEGTFVPIGGSFNINGESVRKVGVPMYTIENTHKDFGWFSGYLETVLSDLVWQPSTVATLADKMKRILTKYAKLTGCYDEKKIIYQAGDFSMRGMAGPEAAYRASAAHLVFFGGSSTVPVKRYLTSYYGAERNVNSYTPSTEHSVMCSYGREFEKEAFLKLITEKYPSGNVTIVSDSYNLWNIVDNVLPEIKDVILNRNGRVNIRPDSGNPLNIICGDPDASDETVKKGIIERLYEIFGGKENEAGFIELDPHIGCVYGDSITPDRAEVICTHLLFKGFASNNIGLGVGSYTYQYMTRDSLGFALKGTAAKFNGEFKPIFKDPATDNDRFKKSQKGLVAVVFEDGDYKLIDNLTPETIKDIKGNELEDVFIDGEFVRTQTFAEIRERAKMESIRVYGS